MPNLVGFSSSAGAWWLALTSAMVACGVLGCGPPRPPESRVTIMQLEAPLTMDPADHTASFTMDVLDPMYESLTRFDQNLEVSPSLATKWSVDSVRNQMDTGVAQRRTFSTTALHSMRKRSWTRSTGCSILIVAWQEPAECAPSSSGSQPNGPGTVVFTLRSSYASFPRVLAVTPIVSPLADKGGQLSRQGCRNRALQVRGVEDRRIRPGRAKRAILGTSSDGKATEMDLDQRAGADEYVCAGG